MSDNDSDPRWARLFGDLEAEAATLATTERAVELAVRVRGELGRLALADRVRAASPARDLVFDVRSGPQVRGRVVEVGAGWVLVRSGRRHVVLAADSVVSVRGLDGHAAPGDGTRVGRALDLRWLIGGLARGRAAVTIRLADGRAVTGTIDRVGADFAELAMHPLDEQRRRVVVRERVAIAIAAIGAIEVEDLSW